MKSIKTIITAFAICFLVMSPAAAADPNAGVEAQVRAAFADAPEMIAIARCESRFRQFSAPGVPLRGGKGRGYIGIFQIGVRLHAARAAAMGDDIDTVLGNIAYARYMYDTSGSGPWECAPAAPAVADAATSTALLTADLKLGMKGAQVQALQRLLNAAGFVIAPSGAGSPGAETTIFGALTRDALRRFQCAKMQVCEGDETTTGYGRLGPKTRALLAL